MKTIKILTFILLLVSLQLLQAQEWSEPVLISTIQGYNDEPDFCIDNNGVIHCVWSHKIRSDYGKIYYSKSEDQGDTWKEPEDISLNDSLWMSQPHIAADSHNNIYVTYDYNSYVPSAMLVLLTKFDGTNWSKPDTISTDMYGSMHNRIVIDNNDRVYVFWYHSEKIYYKYLENNIYSEIFCPYNNGSQNGIKHIVSDKFNNLHCVGHYNYEKAYFTYQYNDSLWSEIFYIGEDTYLSGQDIALDSNQNPHFVWHTKTTDTPPYNDATMYGFFDGINWLPNEIVVEDPQYQTIAIDGNNNVHIANQEKLEKTEKTKAIPSKLVHYQKFQSGWEGQIIDESQHEIANSQLQYYNGRLFIIYVKCYEANDDLLVNIFFSKYQVPVDIPENTINSYYVLEQNYPNPFNNQTIIHFELNKHGQTSLKILDLKANLITTLVNEYKSKGEYNVFWDGTDCNGQKVPPGVYLYRLQVNNRVKTRSLIIY